MRSNAFDIIERQVLANDYLYLTLSGLNLQAQAGHYFIVENTYPCYVMGQNKDKVELLLAPTLKAQLSLHQKLHLSPLQGNALPPPNQAQFTLLIVEPGALSACLFYLKTFRRGLKGFILIGSENHFPFRPCPARQLVSGIPPEVIAAIPLLEDWLIPNRLASLKEIPGVYQGTVQALANLWEKQTPLKDIQKMIIPTL